MSFWSKLFGGGSEKGAKAKVEPQSYKDYAILVDPIREGAGYRVSAVIEKEIGGVVKSHHMIRADVFSDPETAASITLSKAKSLIDGQGDGIFS